MKKLLFLLAIVLMAGNTFATAQIADILVYKRETVPIFSNPLESYFNDKNPRPDSLFRFSCTACWRGYVATWKIDNDDLYLVRLVEGTCSPNATEIEILKIFPEGKIPVRATWFTGTLRIPRGERLSYVHMGYGSTYEKELFLTFEKGKLISEYLVDNTKKRPQQGDYIDRTF